MKTTRFFLTLIAAAGLFAACQGGGPKKTAGPAVSAVKGETPMALDNEGKAITGEDIELVQRNRNRRTGRGEYITTKMR